MTTNERMVCVWRKGEKEMNEGVVGGGTISLPLSFNMNIT